MAKSKKLGRRLLDFTIYITVGLVVVAGTVVAAIYFPSNSGESTTSSPILQGLIALMWVGVGVKLLYQPRRHRDYLRKLSDNPGNREVKALRKRFIYMGVGMIVIGLYWLSRIATGQ